MAYWHSINTPQSYQYKMITILNVYKNFTTILTFINSLIIEQSACYIISYKIVFGVVKNNRKSYHLLKKTNHNKNNFCIFCYFMEWWCGGGFK